MGRTQICVCWHIYRQTLIYCLVLLAAASIFINIVFMAEGRAISNNVEVEQKGIKGGSVMVAKAQIGSRPPKCERRCTSCGHCEAVQVPVVPQVQSHRSNYYSEARARARATTTITYSSRSDDLSNYKPMSWKCKCGDYFFNP